MLHLPFNQWINERGFSWIHQICHILLWDSSPCGNHMWFLGSKADDVQSIKVMTWGLWPTYEVKVKLVGPITDKGLPVDDQPWGSYSFFQYKIQLFMFVTTVVAMVGELMFRPALWAKYTVLSSTDFPHIELQQWWPHI